MTLKDLKDLAPYLENPLVLIAIVAVLLVAVIKGFAKKGTLPDKFAFYSIVLLSGIAMITILLAFGLAFKQADRKVTVANKEVASAIGQLIVKVENEPTQISYTLGVYDDKGLRNEINPGQLIELPLGVYDIRLKRFGKYTIADRILETVSVAVAGETVKSTIVIPEYTGIIRGIVHFDQKPKGDLIVKVRSQKSQSCTDDLGHYYLEVEPANPIWLDITYIGNLEPSHSFQIYSVRPQKKPKEENLPISKELFLNTQIPKCNT